MTKITCEVEARQKAMELQSLRGGQDLLGDRLAWARNWDRDHGGNELIDAIECIQQAIETIGYAISERDDDLRDYEYRRINGPEMDDVYSPAHPYAA